MGFKRKFKHQCTFEEVELYSKNRHNPQQKTWAKYGNQWKITQIFDVFSMTNF